MSGLRGRAVRWDCGCYESRQAARCNRWGLPEVVPQQSRPSRMPLTGTSALVSGNPSAATCESHSGITATALLLPLTRPNRPGSCPFRPPSCRRRTCRPESGWSRRWTCTLNH